MNFEISKFHGRFLTLMGLRGLEDPPSCALGAQGGGYCRSSCLAAVAWARAATFARWWASPRPHLASNSLGSLPAAARPSYAPQRRKCWHAVFQAEIRGILGRCGGREAHFTAPAGGLACRRSLVEPTKHLRLWARGVQSRPLDWLSRILVGIPRKRIDSDFLFGPPLLRSGPGVAFAKGDAF
jgi:hypothetical protein